MPEGGDNGARASRLRDEPTAVDARSVELQRAQQQLQQVRDQYFELFDLAPVAYVTVNRDGNIVEANQAAMHLLTVDRAGLIHSDLAAFVAASDVDLFRLYLSDLFTGGQPCGLEMRVRVGQLVKPVRFEGTAVPASSFGPAHARLALIDLSELRHANHRRWRSQTQYRQLVESLPLGVVVVDRSWLVVDTNEAAARALRMSADELRGARFARVFADNAEWGSVLAEVRRTGMPASATVAHTFGVNDTRWYELRAYEVAEGICVLLWDVSERHLAQLALAENEARFRSVVTAAIDGIMTIGIDGTIESLNPAAEKIFGYAASEVVGQHVGVLMPADDRQEHVAALERYARSGKGTIVGTGGAERRARRADGEVFPIHLSVTEVELGGERSLCCYIRDVTEEKRLEGELRQAQKLDAIGTLASGVAHDFNNLLMGVSGCASIALEAMDPKKPARMYVEEIKKSVDAGAAITRQLLAFSRKSDERPEVFELDRLVAGHEAMLRRLLGEDVELVLKLRARGGRIHMDPGQVEQILINLAVNARDAMPSGGSLVVETRRRGRGKHRAISLRVEDTGHGMRSEILQRAFEPFFTTKPTGKGTGLGLAMVYGIVTRAGGSIDVDSAPGRGTSVDIVLPRVHQDITKDLPRAPVDPVAPSETILLVEDDHTVRMALRHYLEGAGYRVLVAGSGAEAMDCACKYHEPIHALVTDVTLPHGNGREVAAVVRERKPGVSVVFISAHDPAYLIERDQVEPGTRVMQKPFSRAELLHQVRRALAAAETKRRGRPSPPA